MTNLIRVYYVDFSDVIYKRQLQNMLLNDTSDAPSKKQAQTVGKSLLRLVLKEEAEEIIYDSYGKPFIPGCSGVNFSISYSHNLVVLAVSSCGAVGIDVEYIKPRKKESYYKHFTKPEIELLSSGESWEEFYKIWTIKEAVSKAIGKGMRIDFKTINSSSQPISVDGDCWWVEHRPISNYMCSVVSSAQMSLEVEDMTSSLVLKQQGA